MKLDQEPGAFAALKWVNNLGQKPGTRTQAKNLDQGPTICVKIVGQQPWPTLQASNMHQEPKPRSQANNNLGQKPGP